LVLNASTPSARAQIPIYSLLSGFQIDLSLNLKAAKTLEVIEKAIFFATLLSPVLALDEASRSALLGRQVKTLDQDEGPAA
jgi:hypothetical protein